MHLLTAGHVATEDRGELRRKGAATQLKIAVIILDVVKEAPHPEAHVHTSAIVSEANHKQ